MKWYKSAFVSLVTICVITAISLLLRDLCREFLLRVNLH
jgi:hypothetical protein